MLIVWRRKSIKATLVYVLPFNKCCVNSVFAFAKSRRNFPNSILVKESNRKDNIYME